MDRDLARAIEASLNVSQDDRENEPSVIIIDSSDDEDTSVPENVCMRPSDPSKTTQIPSKKYKSIILIESSFEEEDDDYKLARKLQAQFDQERAVIERRKTDYTKFKGKENRPIQSFDDYELARKLQM